MKNYDNCEYKKTNREKRMSPKTGKHYCMVCDMSFIGYGQKCPKCGKVDSTLKSTLKKESNS